MFVSQNGEILTTAPLKESISEMHQVRPYLIPIGVSHNFSLLVETISSDFSKYYKDTSFTITFTLEWADSHKETIITVDDSATE